MGQLDDAVNEAVPGGNFTKPLLIAIGALLLGKMFSGKREEAPAPPPQPQPQTTGGGLGSLVEQFRNAGLGKQADSWVGSGQNQPITAEQINLAIGQGRLAELARQAGLDPAQLSQLLAQALPNVIDKLTPGGQLPKA